MSEIAHLGLKTNAIEIIASRFINLLFGCGLSQTWLPVIAALLLSAGLMILLPTSPWIAGAILFALLTGLVSGLTSTVAGTLPLELSGKAGCGRRLGWCTSAKHFTSATAPFAMSASMAGMGVVPSLWIVACIALIGAAAFLAIPLVLRRGVRFELGSRYSGKGTVSR